MEQSLSALMNAAERGEPAAAESLFTALYAELHRIAKRELARNGWGVSLGATSLLHEAYLDLSKHDPDRFPDQQRFMGYAARVMRGLIIDYARSRQAQKRGGQFQLTTINTDVAESVADGAELTALGAALEELAAVDTAAGRHRGPEVLLRVHGARDRRHEADVPTRTVERSWQKAPPLPPPARSRNDLLTD